MGAHGLRVSEKRGAPCRPAALAGSAGFLLLLLLLLSASSAYAGKYHDYVCRRPSGAVASTEGWTGTTTKGASFATITKNTCAESGALIAALTEETTHETEQAYWALEVPSVEKLTAATIWRASRGHFRQGEQAVYDAFLSGPLYSKVFDSCSEVACSSQGVIGTPFAESNKVVVPSANLGAHLYASAGCGAFVEGDECGSGFGDPLGYDEVEFVYAADLVLEQTELPTAGTPSGPLVSETPIHGTSDIVFTASDPGAGIYKAVFNVDGSVVQENIINENEGRCKSVGETTDGLPAFTYLLPCPKAVSADVGLDTTKLSNGHHHVIVSVTDAAGNSAFVLDREVEVQNKTPPSFIWKVAGSELGSGASKTLSLKAAPAGKGKTFVLKGKVGSTAIKVESSKLSASSAAITGGKPGGGHATLTFEGVTVAKPEKCELSGGKLTTKPLTLEVVEAAEEKSKVKEGLEETALKLSPTTGSTFAELTFAGSECTLKGTTAVLAGEGLIELAPQKEEAETGHWSLEKTAKKVFRNSSGSYGTAELTIGGKAANLEGEAEATLTSKERFGAF